MPPRRGLRALPEEDTLSTTYAEQVLAAIARHDHGMGALDDPSAAVLQHVSRHTDDGEVREDSCPCSRGEETLSRDEIGRPVVQQLGEGLYLSSGRHTLADLVRDVIQGG
jgi:hypothetical protein